MAFCKSTSHITENIPHPTSRTFNIPRIPHPEHLTFRTSHVPNTHIPNIPHQKHTTSRKSHILKIPHLKHPTSQASRDPMNIDSLNLSFVLIYAQGVLTGFYSIWISIMMRWMYYHNIVISMYILCSYHVILHCQIWRKKRKNKISYRKSWTVNAWSRSLDSEQLDSCTVNAWTLPSKHFLFSKKSWRRLQRNNFSSSKTSWKRFHDC